MNDYKDLIEDLRLGLTCGPYRAVTVLKSMLSQAADAIEQLVKERDVLQLQNHLERCEHEHTRKERDAAVADLKFVIAHACDLDFCLWCKHREFDGQCHHDCIPCSEKWGWEWRGVQEAEHE